MLALMISNTHLFAQASCPVPRDPSDVVKIEILSDEAAKAKGEFEDAGTTTKKKYLKVMRKLVILLSTKQEAVKKVRAQLDLDEISLKALDQQILDQLTSIVGAQKASELMAQWNQGVTEAERAKIISEYAGPKGSYASLLVAAATKRGLGAEALKEVKDVSLEFASVTSGEFKMGSPAIEEGRSIDEGQRKVKITKPFEIGKTEVTQLQYALIMGANPSRFVDANAADYMEVGGTKLNANHPVEMVSWQDAQEFVRKLNEQDSKYNYRLPTEAEWEYATRAGSTTPYSFENRKQDLGEQAVYWDNSGSKTAAVASKKANSLGLYDVHGNVWEWCNDWYCEAPKSVEDPAGPDSGSYRVFRGGSWLNRARDLRSAYRDSAAPGYRNVALGFRLVRTAK